MLYAKKFLFAPFFLGALAYYWFSFRYFAQHPYAALSIDKATLIQVAIVSIAVLVVGLFFTLFVSLAYNRQLVMPILLAGSLIPILFYDLTTGLVLACLSLFALSLPFYLLVNRLKTYFTFEPARLLTPVILNLVTLLLLASCAVVYMAANKDITANGFSIPDGLVDLTLKINLPQQGSATGNTNKSQETGQFQLPRLSQEQINQLKQRPEILQQYGLKPADLDTLLNAPKAGQTQPGKHQSDSQNLVKVALKNQLNAIVKPYLSFVPIVLTLLLFITLKTVGALVAILLPIFIPAIFWLLEKFSIIHFEVEMRPAKKLVV